MLGPLGAGFEIADGPALLVGGGIGAAILPWLARELAGSRRASLLGFRSEAHAVCAGADRSDEPTVVLDPVLVTEPLARMLPFDGIVYACGPDPMLHAVAALCAEHDVPCQVAMEAAMACGYGACYGCAVQIDGVWKRLCVEGPVLEAGGPGVSLDLRTDALRDRARRTRWSTARARWTRWSPARWGWPPSSPRR